MNAIVCTTINPPTEAIGRFSKMDGWKLVIVGDRKTPHDKYLDMISDGDGIVYLSPEWQESEFPAISQLIGWNCIQRRNFGFIWAFLAGCDIVATVDDDNIPAGGWGAGVLVNTKSEVTMYDTDLPVFDPLSPTSRSDLWHRGFPIQLVKDKNNIRPIGKPSMEVLVQADLWDGEADVDAIERISMKTSGVINGSFPFTSSKISPFNSQNTFISGKHLPDYFLFPHIGRMDDIWASYYFQHKHPGSVIYGSPSVLQDRNEHSLVTDMKNEVIGYEHSLSVARNPQDVRHFMPAESWEAFIEYRKAMGVTEES